MKISSGLDCRQRITKPAPAKTLFWAPLDCWEVIVQTAGCEITSFAAHRYECPNRNPAPPPRSNLPRNSSRSTEFEAPFSSSVVCSNHANLHRQCDRAQVGSWGATSVGRPEVTRSVATSRVAICSSDEILRRGLARKCTSHYRAALLPPAIKCARFACTAVPLPRSTLCWDALRDNRTKLRAETLARSLEFHFPKHGELPGRRHLGR